MNKCVNCDYTTENDEKLCPNCGGEIVVDAPAAEVPAKKGKKIVGVILSVIGLICASGCILLSLLSDSIAPVGNIIIQAMLYSLELPYAFISLFALVLNLLILGSDIICIATALVGLILAIIGLILSRKGGKLGKILSIIAIVLVVLYAAGFVIGFIFEFIGGFIIGLVSAL